MASLFGRLLGHPFVYDQVRPRVVGGIDMRPLYDLLGEEAQRVVLDVGCGTGDALRYLPNVQRYLGIDTDPVAIEAARRRFGDLPHVRFECQSLREEDVLEFEPTGVVLAGVLHHLTNEEAHGVLKLAHRSPRLVRLVTSDIVFLPGMFFNNVLAMMDRGRFCREPDAYASLARRAGFELRSGMTVPSSPGNTRVRYHVMALCPTRPAGATL